jgi:hypothetical protein
MTSRQWSGRDMAQSDTRKYDIGVGGEAFLSAKDLKEYMMQRQRAELAKEEARRQRAEKAQADQIAQLMTHVEVTAERLANFMTRLRQAAEQGQNQVLVLRFPSDLCTDRGRAINNGFAGWEDTLVGVPKQMIEVWREHLKPLGYVLRAEVLDYPGGMPGDIGLFCRW